jgi:ubiquinone/menaquinone biosynthesis C-methylase UbiE
LRIRHKVEAFDRNQRSSSEQAEQALIEWLGISAGHTVIDLGAGTGTFAIQAGKAGAYVHAVDVSPTMLAYAQKKACAANAENVEFHHAGFLTYEHQGNPVDFIVTKNNGIQASPFEGDLIYGMIIAVGFSTSNESPRV